MELSDPHKAQVSKFVTYFKGKRERLLADRESEKAEFKTDRLADDEAIFNKADVEDLLDTYHAQIVGCIREELEGFINLSAVYLSQVLLQAQQSSLTLDAADLAAIEDHNRSDELASLVLSGSAPPPLVKRAVTGALPALAPVAAAGPDPATLQKLEELRAENEQMQERYRLMQNQVAALLKERSMLTAELEKIGGEAAAAAAAAAAASAAAGVPTERIGDMSQFKELKAIVKKKSDEVKELRKRLQAAGLPLPADDGGVDVAPEDD